MRNAQNISRMHLWMLCIALIGCNREQAPDCFQAAGDLKTVRRDLSEFTSIELNDYIHYELCDTSFFGVEVTAPANLIPEINTTVEGAKLTVHNRNSCNFVRSYKNRITVRICAPDFADIQNYATGDMRSVNQITGKKFSIDNRSAAGVQTFDVQVDTVNVASHTGVSDTYVTGKSDVVYLFSQGLGIVNAAALDANYAFVNNSSLNNVFVRSSDYLFAFLQFSGNIFYSGNPQFVDPDVEGTGALIAQ